MSQNRFLLGVLLCGLSSAALASGVMPPPPQYNPGPYFGFQLGWALADEGDGFKDSANALYNNNLAWAEEHCGGSFTHKSDRGGFGGRGFIGFNFIRYFSLEAGYSFFPDNKYSTYGAFDKYPDNPDSLNFTNKTYAFDIVAKGILPLTSATSIEGWDLYGKLGLAYVHSKWFGSFLNGDYVNKFISGSRITTGLRPMYSLGVAYNINQHFILDLSYTGIYGQNRVSQADIDAFVYTPNQTAASAAAANIKPIPTTHLVALGLAVKFDI